MLGRWRVNTFLLLLCLAAGGLFYRLVFLAYLQGDSWRQRSDAQYASQQQNSVERGNIYISDQSSDDPYLVATNKLFPYIYVIPKSARDTETLTSKLSELLKISSIEISSHLENRADPFEVIVRDPDAEQISVVQNLNWPEVKVGQEVRRYYPAGNFLAQTLGFVGYSGEARSGQYGVEGYYDKILRGQEISGVSKTGDIVLTIDRNIQAFAEKELNYLMEKWQPENGNIIVQDPNTGAILAMAGSPSFDPNRYQYYQLSDFTNKSVQEMFEPGSSFKPVTMSGALDKRALTPETTYFDAGEVVLNGYHIKNYNEKSNGVQTMYQVLEKSLNTGAMFAEDRLGDENFLDYVINFGFGQPTGIDLAGEIGGDVSNLYTKRKINFATASFGQGIATTPIQLINAYSALANGGKLLKPYLAKVITEPDGQKKITQTEIIGTPVSERATLDIKKMLAKVVEIGFDKARVKGYDIAGKTGTAQIASKEGGYSDQFIHDMVGFAPAFDPKFVVLIKMEKPQGIKFAADSLSPSLGNMMKFLLNYFHIPPNPSSLRP